MDRRCSFCHLAYLQNESSPKTTKRETKTEKQRKKRQARKQNTKYETHCEICPFLPPAPDGCWMSAPASLRRSRPALSSLSGSLLMFTVTNFFFLRSQRFCCASERASAGETANDGAVSHQMD